MTLYRVRTDFDLLAGAEAASIAFHVSAPPGSLDTLADEYQSAFLTAWVAGIDDHMTPDCKATRCVVSELAAAPPNGTVSSVERTLNVVGAGDGTTAPPQLATCVTIVTPFTGRRFRGRMYWPFTRLTSVGAGGRAGAAYCAALAEFWRAVFQAIIDQPTLDVPGVWSAVDQQLTGATAVKVGNVIDTQRRRRDELVEVYTVEDLV